MANQGPIYKMNIIHAVPTLGQSGGGPPRSVSQLCNALVARDISIGIVTAVDVNDPIAPLDSRITLIGVEAMGDTFLGRLKACDFSIGLDRAHFDSSISVIHQHGIWLRSSHATSRYARRNNIPLVVAPRGMLEPWALNHSKWKKKCAWKVFQQRDLSCATAFHATAHSEAESIRRLGFNQPIAVIPNGVVMSKAGDLKLKIADGGADAQSSDKKTALFLSRINPKKGLPMLLDAWSRLEPKGWRLVIAGNDDSNHLPVVEASIAKHGLEEKVYLVGPLFGEAKDAAFRDADLFVLPSYSENFGIVVTEALGSNLPVLTTTGCPWQELESHGCGWWVDPTVSALKAGLRDAFSKSDCELQHMGQRGRLLVENKYQWPEIARSMAEFYRWLLEGGERPDFVV